MSFCMSNHQTCLWFVIILVVGLVLCLVLVVGLRREYEEWVVDDGEGEVLIEDEIKDSHV